MVYYRKFSSRQFLSPYFLNWILITVTLILSACGAGGGGKDGASGQGSVFGPRIDEALLTVNVGSDRGANINNVFVDANTSKAPSKVYSWSKLSGPGTVTFSNPASEDTTVTVGIEGRYNIQLKVTTENNKTVYDNFWFTYDATLPIANAGVDQSSNGPTLLSATASDTNPISYQWSKVAGPGNLVFNNSNALQPTVSATADGVYTVRLTVTDIGGNTAVDDMILTWEATAPAVNVGTDLVLNAATVINATATDANPMTFQWSQISGPGTITFGSPTLEDSNVSASADGTYVLRLTATDSFTNSNYDELTLTWDTTSPVVNVGANVNANNLFTTSATVTDITTLTYSWSQQAGPGVITFGASSALNTSVNASVDGTYTIRLTATDSLSQSAFDEFTLTWDATAPSVNAGTDKTSNITVGQFATATDANPLTYQWSKTSGPGNVVFGTPNNLNTSITPDADGVYVIRLTATDSFGNSAWDEMTLTWDTSGPTVNAGTDKNTNSIFTQDATASDVHPISYSWTKQAGPGNVIFGASSAQDTQITADTDGTYTIRLTATDSLGNSSFDDMVLIWDTTPPVVDAGVDVTTKTSVSQNATATDTNTMTYAWTKQTGAGNVLFSPANTEDTVISADTDGNYTLRLTVTDGAGNTAFDEMIFTRDTVPPPSLAGFSAVTSTSIETGRIDWTITFPADTSDYDHVDVRREVGASFPGCTGGLMAKTYNPAFVDETFTDDTSYPGGLHSYSACVYDAAGNVTVISTASSIKANKTHKIFQTSAGFSGNLNSTFDAQTFTDGLEGADYRCQYYADLAGLGMKFVALISDSTIDAKRKVAINGKVYLTDSTLVVNDILDLWDGDIGAAIERDENGLLGGPTWVWTGTTTAGESDLLTCLDWSDSSLIQSGGRGRPNKTIFQWIADTSSSCDTIRGLYCISQIDIPNLNSFTAVAGAAAGEIDLQVRLPSSFDVKYYEKLEIRRLAGATAPDKNCDANDGSALIHTINKPFNSNDLFTHTDTGTAGNFYSYRACIIDEDNNQVGSLTVTNVQAAP